MSLLASLLAPVPPATRSEAIADARRKLALTLHRKVDSAVASAAVIDEGFLSEKGVYQVRLRTVPISADAVGTPEKETFSSSEPATPGAPAPRGARYTGLIIDCHGLRLRATPSPKLWSSEGQEVYGTMSVSDEFLFDQGIVAYPRSLDLARRSARVGEHPLVIRAFGLRDSTGCEPVISHRDAQYLISENRHDHFLERCAVVFVLDP